jgi:hypothetical protein
MQIPDEKYIVAFEIVDMPPLGRTSGFANDPPHLAHEQNIIRRLPLVRARVLNEPPRPRRKDISHIIWNPFQKSEVTGIARGA